MGEFGMTTGEVHAGGVRINNQADEFSYAHKKLNDTIEFLLQAYPSNDGKEIAEAVKGYEPMVNDVETRLHNNGEFSIYASKTTVNANEEVVSKIADRI